MLSGKVSKRSRLQAISVPDPGLFAATAIREYLATKGIAIAGNIRFERVRTASGDLPSDCRIIADYKTPLPDVLRRIGINSQNMFAEALFKRVGYEWATRHGDSPAIGSWEKGRQAVTAFLKRAGCDTARMTVSDGSGLSRANRVSASDFVRILTFMHTHPQRDLFKASLGGNRTGGGLKKRMANIGGDVYAKTGSMRGIRTLSGYVKTQDDRWFAFSVLFNGFRGSSGPYNRIHDKICRILAKMGK